MNKLVRSCAIALGLVCVAGSASAIDKWNWQKSEGGVLTDVSNWTKDGKTLEKWDETAAYRILGTSNLGERQVLSSDLTLNGDMYVEQFDFGYSTYTVEGILNLGVGNKLNCNAFNVIDGAVGTLTSGTIIVKGNALIGKNGGGAGNRETKFTIDGSSAKLDVRGSGKLAVGYSTKTNSCFEVLNGAAATVESDLYIGYDGPTVHNTFLVAGEGSDFSTTSAVEIGAKSNSSDNRIIVTDGANFSCSQLVIGSASDDETGSSGNVFVLANGATFDMNGKKVVHLGRSGQPGNALVISNASFVASSFELYKPSHYPNAEIYVAGTNGYLSTAGRNFPVYDTHKVVLDIHGPIVNPEMVKSNATISFDKGSKLVITTTQDLSKVNDFDVVALYGEGGLVIAEGVIECDKSLGFSYEIDEAAHKLIVHYKRPVKIDGTHVFFF